MDCLAKEKKQSRLKLEFSARRVLCHCSARQSPSVNQTRFSNPQPRASLYLHQPIHLSRFISLILWTTVFRNSLINLFLRYLGRQWKLPQRPTALTCQSSKVSVTVSADSADSKLQVYRDLHNCLGVQIKYHCSLITRFPSYIFTAFEIMKVLIAGATGGIGSQALGQSLAHPQITTVVAFTRRNLPLKHPKLDNILIKDFGRWPEDVLIKHADAAGMIWYIGSTPFLASCR